VLLIRTMKYKRRPVIIAAIILLLIGVALLCGLLGSVPSNSIRPPAGWVRINAGEFVFFLPPDVKFVPVMDSFDLSYKGNSISLSFEYGGYSDPLENSHGAANRVWHSERIDGKHASVASSEFYNASDAFGYTVGVKFPKQGLTMVAKCKTEADCKTARNIFRTVKFKRNGIAYYFRYFMQLVTPRRQHAGTPIF